MKTQIKRLQRLKKAEEALSKHVSTLHFSRTPIKRIYGDFSCLEMAMYRLEYYCLMAIEDEKENDGFSFGCILDEIEKGYEEFTYNIDTLISQIKRGETREEIISVFSPTMIDLSNRFRKALYIKGWAMYFEDE